MLLQCIVRRIVWLVVVVLVKLAVLYSRVVSCICHEYDMVDGGIYMFAT